uniref:Ig-like domain-containing protein n=1 Tax=Pygocentrus nattereri TaxID=42514 RepID=A0A3B4EDK5_PYGNA
VLQLYFIQYKSGLSRLVLCVSGVLSVSLSSQAGLTVEAEPGDDVTLWCKHSLTKSAHLFWCKHTNNSVSVYIACRYYSLTLSPHPCFFIPESKRSVMGVNSTFSSLTITAVNLSDSGLYYCSTLRDRYMIFSNTTHLQIRERSRISSRNPDEPKKGQLFTVFTCRLSLLLLYIISLEP